MTIAIRLATVDDAEGIAHVHVDSWRTTYQGMVPDEYLARLSYDVRQERWQHILSSERHRSVTLVAQDETDRIIGFIGGGMSREHADSEGELYAIYLLAQSQGQGIGKRLVYAFTEKMLTLNFSAMLVKALAENPACRFYEALGAQYVHTEQIEIGGKLLDERVYRWPDLQTILKK